MNPGFGGGGGGTTGALGGTLSGGSHKIQQLVRSRGRFHLQRRSRVRSGARESAPPRPPDRNLRGQARECGALGQEPSELIRAIAPKMVGAQVEECELLAARPDELGGESAAAPLVHLAGSAAQRARLRPG